MDDLSIARELPLDFQNLSTRTRNRLPDIAAVRASLRRFGRVLSIPEILTNSPPARPSLCSPQG
jgi:hypothetical protein